MSALPCATPIIQRTNAYDLINKQYSFPVQRMEYQHEQQYQQYLLHTPLNNSLLMGVQNPIVLNQSSAGNNPCLFGTTLRKVPPQNFVDARPIGNKFHSVNCPPLMSGNGNTDSDFGSSGKSIILERNVSQPLALQKTQVPPKHQLNSNVNVNEVYNEDINKRRTECQTDCLKSKPPENQAKPVPGIPELTQVKVDTDQKDKIGILKIKLSGSFVSWNIAEKTLLDLNFMRNIFCITNLDLVFQSDSPYEAGLCEGLNKLVQNKLLSDWLVLKCEDKQIPVFKVSNLVQLYSVNNFVTLLSIVAQESCLPLPFVKKNGQEKRYYYINFPKSINQRVKKLNIPVFHDADNGRKKLSCKYPGIRLDCNFENAILKFDIYVHATAASAYQECVTRLRQVIIYKHLVWGFLQAWTRRIREHYNSCLKIQDIAQNLCLCRSNTREPEGKSQEDKDLVYYIDYSNFYLKFDPVELKDTTLAFTIENFETNYVCDVSLIQYYRQFFLINDMHYSDALKNLIIFSEDFEANQITDFAYVRPKKQNIKVPNTDYYRPRGMSKATAQHHIDVISPDASTATSSNDLHHSCPVEKQFNEQAKVSSLSGSEVTVISPVNLGISQKANKEKILQEQKSPVRSKGSSRPLIKTRTVEEINSSVMRNEGSEDKSDKFYSDSLDRRQECHLHTNPALPSYINQILNDCYARNPVAIAHQNSSTEPRIIHEIFNTAVSQAFEMTTVDAFVDMIYVTLQKYFTNSFCQALMNRTIRKLLTLKFPILRQLLKPSQSPKETLSSTGGPRLQKLRKVNSHTQSGEKVMQPNQEGNITTLQRKVHVPVIQEKTPKISDPKSQTEPKSVKISWLDHSYSKDSSQPDKNNHINNSRSAKETGRQLNPASHSLSTAGAAYSSEQSTCEMDNPMEKQTNETGKSVEKAVRLRSDKKSVKGDEIIAEVNTTLTETEQFYSNSINLTLPSSNGSHENISSEVTSKVVHFNQSSPVLHQNTPIKSQGSCQLQRSCHVTQKLLEQHDESAFTAAEMEKKSLKSKTIEEDLFARFNLKPCMVVLNAVDITKLTKKCPLRQKKGRAVNHGRLSKQSRTNSTGALVRNTKGKVKTLPNQRNRIKFKGASKLEPLEAKTGGLQRSHKRNKMNANGEDELENPVQNSSRDERKKMREKEEEKYRTIYLECLRRKAKVVLSRIDDGNRENTEKAVWKVSSNSDGCLTLKRDRIIQHENIPKNKRRFFELKEGKLYLKKQYQVKNGKIVLINPDTRESKTELIDSDFISSNVKKETSLDT